MSIQFRYLKVKKKSKSNIIILTIFPTDMAILSQAKFPVAIVRQTDTC